MGTIGRTNTGGAGLNLSIYPSTTQPANPVENMFWVNTDLAIPHWYFQNDEPSDPETGDLYVTTPTTSTNVLQLLRNNGIKLCFGTPRQYSGEAWEKVGGKLYYNGSWHNLQIFVYDGTIGDAEYNFNHDVGGYPWSKTNITGVTTSLSAYSSYFSCGASSAAAGAGTIYAKNTIDFTDISSVKITYGGTGGSGSVRAVVFTGTSSGAPTGVKAYVSMGTDTSSRRTVTIDTSAVTGSYRLGIYFWSDASGYSWGKSRKIYSIELVS